MRRILAGIAVFLTVGSAAADPDGRLRPFQSGIFDATELKREAAGGDPVAQYWLGMRYLDGKWFAPNQEQAVHWIAKAAIQGFEPARIKLEELGRTETIRTK